MFREGLENRTDQLNMSEQKYLIEMTEREANGEAVIMWHAGKGFRYILTEKNGVDKAEKRGYIATEKQTKTIEVPVIKPGSGQPLGAVAATKQRKATGKSKAAQRAAEFEAAVDAAEGTD